MNNPAQAGDNAGKKIRFNLKAQLRSLDEKIWRVPSKPEAKSAGAKLYALLRMIVLTVQGVGKNKIPSQAAALAYASLIALGPMIALAIMISGFVLKDKGEDFATQKLHQAIEFIAPQVSIGAYDGEDTESFADATVQANPQIVQMINSLVKKAGTGTGGAIGSLLLAVICIRLIISIENTFNLIWGVRRGRSLFQRILGYWAVLTLGSVLGFTAAGLLTTSTLVGHIEGLAKHLPGISVLISYLGPCVAIGVLVLLLTLFYRYIPKTNVRWLPALAGGAVVTVLILLNYFLSFFYVSYVLRQESLYGSIGIVFVLMFGLYIFWLFMLLGGQITYAVQNMEHVAHERAWRDASPHVRQMLALAVFLQCARAFERCQDAPNAPELSEKLGAPLHLVNEALSQMCDRNILSAVETPAASGDIVLRYQPARPLDKFRVIDLRFELDSEGNSEGLDLLSERDPALPVYINAMNNLRKTPELGATMLDLIKRTNPQNA